VDLPRTFAELALFDKTGPFNKQLLEVLGAYSVFRPSIGYVQGMTYLAGMLLLHMEPYDTFVCLCNLFENHFFVSLFKMDIPQIIKHIRIYDLLLSRTIPHLYDHFSNLGISAEHYLLDWFLTLFSKSLKLNVASRIWDCFFLEGEIFLHRAAVGIIKKLQSEIEKAPFEVCIMKLRQLPQHLDEGELMETILTVHIPKYLKSITRRLNDTFDITSIK